MKPVNKIINAVVKKVDILYFLLINKYTINPKKTTTAVACPLGREKLVSEINAFSGLALPIIYFKTFIKIPVAIIVEMRKIPFFLETLKYKYRDINIDIIPRAIGSKIYAIAFENDVRIGLSIDCINALAAVSIVILISNECNI